MYINDIHILLYLSIGVIGLIVGQLIDWCNNRLAKYEKVLSKDFFTQYLSNATPQYLLMSITAISYVLVLYFNGLTVDTLKYVILIPMLINVFVIDCKKQIIPNRLTLTIFEIGLIFISMQVIINTNTGINTFLNSLLGMLIGGGIFLIINLVGKLFSQKEAMGFGDAKLMAVLGLFFGKNNIIIIFVIAFIIAALVSIAMLIKSKIKKQNMTEYIAFGPFIVLATAVIIYMPNDVFITMLSKILRIS